MTPSTTVFTVVIVKSSRRNRKKGNNPAMNNPIIARIETAAVTITLICLAYTALKLLASTTPT